jgi:hypothetical protein
VSTRSHSIRLVFFFKACGLSRWSIKQSRTGIRTPGRRVCWIMPCNNQRRANDILKEKMREAESSDIGSERRYSTTKRRDEDMEMDTNGEDRKRSKRDERDREKDRSRGKDRDKDREREKDRDRDRNRSPRRESRTEDRKDRDRDREKRRDKKEKTYLDSSVEPEERDHKVSIVHTI